MRDQRYTWNNGVLLLALACLLASKTCDAGVSYTWGQQRIRVAEAHRLGGTGSPKVVVAVIDTGIDPDAVPGMVPGYDVVADKAGGDVDTQGHGSHCGGIIRSIAPTVSIMPIRYYDEHAPGSVNLANTVKAIRYAVDHGADIINYSAGGAEGSETERLELMRAGAHGVLVVTAAGNEHRDIDEYDQGYYPTSYRLSNMITVASVDRFGELAASSDWGRHTVDLAAPGDAIYSTLPDGRYGYMSGTSQATAMVSGVAALVLSHNTELSPKQVREIILDTARKPKWSLGDKVLSGGVLDAVAAVRAARSP